MAAKKAPNKGKKCLVRKTVNGKVRCASYGGSKLPKVRKPKKKR